MRTQRAGGRIIVMCHGMNATCPNPADEFDYIQSGYYCRRCIEFHASLPTSWSARRHATEQERDGGEA